MFRQIFLVALLFLVSTNVVGQSPCKAEFDATRHKATDAYKSAFSYDQPFAQYLAAMRTLIEFHNPRAGEILHGSLTVGAAISPFEIPPRAGCSADTPSKGILLIHGLTDTPYLMHELGEHFADRCFLARSILLPGHGTIPGDMTNVEYAEWTSATKYGIEDLAATVDDVYVAGFSTGGALALHYVFGAGYRDAQEVTREKIRGLILLAPAIDVKSRFAWMADEKVWINRHLLNREAWRPVAPDADLVKYESFNVNAGAQIYGLTKELMGITGPKLDIPLFIALSESDQTVDSKTTVRFFRSRAPEKSKLILYTNKGPFDLSCPETGVCRRKAERSEAGVYVLDFAHVSIPLSGNDPYYGKQGIYRSCTHYLDSNDCSAYGECMSSGSSGVYYGETTDQNLGKGIVRRLTWNPDHPKMLSEMDRFVASTLQVDQ